MDSKIFRCSLAAVAALAIIGVGGGTAAQAQMARTGQTHNVTAGQLIDQFETDTGAQITTDDMDLGVLVTVPAQGFANRAQTLNAIATALDARWHKVYVVTRATTGEPAVYLSDARHFVDGTGVVSFDAQSMSASSAISAAAQADGATVEISPSVSHQAVTISSGNLSVADAIALVSSETQTHWALEYRFTASGVDYQARTASNSGTVVPLYMRRENHHYVTDPTSRIPNYYAPIYVHMRPADQQITYDPYGYVIPQQPVYSSSMGPMGPQVYTPSSSGLIVNPGLGYSSLASPYYGASSVNPYGYDTSVVSPTTTSTTGVSTTGVPMTGLVYPNGTVVYPNGSSSVNGVAGTTTSNGATLSGTPGTTATSTTTSR